MCSWGGRNTIRAQPLNEFYNGGPSGIACITRPSINPGLKRAPAPIFSHAGEKRDDGGSVSNLPRTDGRFPLNLPDLSHAPGSWQRARRAFGVHGGQKQVQGDSVPRQSGPFGFATANSRPLV